MSDGEKQRNTAPLLTILAIVTMALLPTFSLAETISYEAGTKLITDTAERLCKTVPVETQDQKYDLSLSGKAELGGLIKKFTDAGLSGAGSVSGGSSSRAVLEKDLAGAIKDNQNCGTHIFDTLVVVFFPPSPPPPPPCKRSTVPRSGPMDTTNWQITKNPTLHLDVADNEKIVHAYVVSQNPINGVIHVSNVTIDPDGKHATATCSVDGPGGGHTNSVGECYIQGTVEISSGNCTPN
jgi:hypothetical protein